MSANKFFIALMLLFGTACAEEVGVMGEKEEGCFGGEVVSKDLFRGEEKVGMVAVNEKCLDKNPDSTNSRKDYPGAVSFVLCLPDFSFCKENNDRLDVVYLTFLIPHSEFVTKYSALYLDERIPIASKGGVDVYVDDKNHKEKVYISNVENYIFNVSCRETKHGSCDAMGLVGHEIQYFAMTRYKAGRSDWVDFHEEIKGFIEKSVQMN